MYNRWSFFVVLLNFILIDRLFIFVFLRDIFPMQGGFQITTGILRKFVIL